MDQLQKFIPLNLYVLRLDTLKPFDIYIKIGYGKNKYVLYSRKGKYFTSRVRQKLLMNNVSTIYVPDEDRDTYQQYIEDNLQYIVKDNLVTPEQKSAVVYESSRYVMEKLFENPRAEIISRTKKTVDNIVSLILSDRKATSQLIRITEYDYYTYTHSVNVGVFSVAFARELFPGIADREFYDLALGFFLHDIGKSEIPIEILNKPGSLNQDEWNIMRSHPEKGYKILENTGYIRRESAIIVLQHHERSNGSGYPKGLTTDAIHVYAKICAIADTFDAMTTKRCYQKPVTAYESLDFIRQRLFEEQIDRDFFEKFVLLFAPEKSRDRHMSQKILLSGTKPAGEKRGA
ncbi:MAG: HD domain-containing phosphohydrolase [Pseudomonadota bacterium]